METSTRIDDLTVSFEKQEHWKSVEAWKASARMNAPSKSKEKFYRIIENLFNCINLDPDYIGLSLENVIVTVVKKCVRKIFYAEDVQLEDSLLKLQHTKKTKVYVIPAIKEEENIESVLQVLLREIARQHNSNPNLPKIDELLEEIHSNDFLYQKPMIPKSRKRDEYEYNDHYVKTEHPGKLLKLPSNCSGRTDTESH